MSCVVFDGLSVNVGRPDAAVKALLAVLGHFEVNSCPAECCLLMTDIGEAPEGAYADYMCFL